MDTRRYNDLIATWKNSYITIASCVPCNCHKRDAYPVVSATQPPRPTADCMRTSARHDPWGEVPRRPYPGPSGRSRIGTPWDSAGNVVGCWRCRFPLPGWRSPHMTSSSVLVIRVVDPSPVVAPPVSADVT